MQHLDTTTDVFPSHYTREQVIALLTAAGRVGLLLPGGTLCIAQRDKTGGPMPEFRPTSDGLFRASSVLRFLAS